MQTAKILSRQREFQIELKARGLCTNCAKPRQDKSYWCDKCYEHFKEYKRRKRLERTGSPIRHYKCSVCGENGHGKRTCKMVRNPVT